MDDELRHRITVNPDVMVGKPAIRGTRIPVETVLDKLAYNLDVDEILNDYPTLTRDDIRACVDYAYAILQGEQIFPVSTPTAES